MQKGQEPPDKLPRLKNTNYAKEPQALLKGIVMCSSAWWLFKKAVKGNHPWTDNSWQQASRARSRRDMTSPNYFDSCVLGLHSDSIVQLSLNELWNARPSAAND